MIAIIFLLSISLAGLVTFLIINYINNAEKRAINKVKEEFKKENELYKKPKMKQI